jgi:S1-C subfamily serine protease
VKIFQRQITFLAMLGLGAWLFSFATITATARTTATRQKKRGASTQAPTGFRVVKSEVGSKGEEKDGNYVVEDIRTTFHIPADKQVVVYFEWEGPSGAHHFQGTWRDPQGKVVATGTFDYSTPDTRFSGYWVLELPPDSPPGLWALEAQIDGQPAGEQTFQVTAPPPPPPPKPMLTTAQIYQQVLASGVFVIALDDHQEPFRTGSGFFIGSGIVLTAFEVIDGSSSIQIDLPDGSKREVDSVLAWNRAQDWALLAVDGTKVPPLKRAQPGSWKVGDPCYVTDSPSPGSRSILLVAITGMMESKKDGGRFTISWNGSSRAIGSPVLDRYGNLIGMVGGSPDFQATNAPAGLAYPNSNAIPAGPQVIPASLIQNPSPNTKPATLAQMAAQGLLIPPVDRDSQIISGYLCKDFKQVANSLQPFYMTDDFLFRDGQFAIVVIWNPSEKIKSTDQFRVYDTDNNLWLQNKPAKIQLKPHDTEFTGWKVPISQLKPGVYRLDVLLGGRPEWRTYLRIQR